MYEALIAAVSSIGSGFLADILLCYFLENISKIPILIAGGIVALLSYLQQQQIISVNTYKLQESLTFIFTSVSALFDEMTHIDHSTSLGISLTGPLSAYSVTGFVKNRK